MDRIHKGILKPPSISLYNFPDFLSMIPCSKCGKKSVTFIRYNGTHLCREHFIDFFTTRVKKESRKQFKLKSNDHIAVAVSGGKDSIVTLLTLYEIFEPRRDVELSAITVDEGIKGYRPSSIEIAKKYCSEYDIPFHLINFKETIGYTMDEISGHCGALTPCTYCGVYRRRCLNMKAKEIGATKLATGLNLDDTAQSILMNFTRGDVEKLARLGPHKRVQPGLIPRIQPVRTIPEKEMYLLAVLKGIDIHDRECPYSERALRGTYREIINRLEEKTPGTRHAILQSHDSMAELLFDKFPPSELKDCKSCGEPSTKDLCKGCTLLKNIR